jgi:hypothetical protein
MWPEVPVEHWEATRDTLHLWSQIVGKVRMRHAPPLNHWWHVTLYLTPHGLTTSLVPHTSGGFEIDFDFLEDQLRIRHVDGRDRLVRLEPRSVADFYDEVVARLRELDIEGPAYPRPVEVEDNTPFPDDHHHSDYDPAAVRTFFGSLVDAHRVFSGFRSRFTGKASPVHFFWGSFDLAVTFFSGRGAPLHPGGMVNCPDWVMHEAYSQEVSSAGYWPGGADEGIFYAYAYPEPTDYRLQPAVSGAEFSGDLGEFVFPYRAVRTSDDPDTALDRFLTSTFTAAAVQGGWDLDWLSRSDSESPPWSLAQTVRQATHR